MRASDSEFSEASGAGNQPFPGGAAGNSNLGPGYLLPMVILKITFYESQEWLYDFGQVTAPFQASTILPVKQRSWFGRF